MTETVELYPAHGWDCPECGSQNFCRGITFEPSEEERREMTELLGADEPVDGAWTTIPETVTCRVCDCEFPAKHFRDDPCEGML